MSAKAIGENQWIPASNWPRGTYWVVVAAKGQAKKIPIVVE
jgi:hypothetical protein